MESPPSYSNHSEVPPLSEDSGLLITSGSFSSDSASGWHHIASELQESDFDERSLSYCESTEPSDRMCGDFFNTVKKGPGKVAVNTIEPPPEFQDNPISSDIVKCRAGIVSPSIVCTDDTVKKLQSSSFHITVTHVSPIHIKKLKPECLYDRRQSLTHRFASPRLLHRSPCRALRPASRSSLSSRLSSSHNSLVTQFQADDSSFITQAISHDTLSAKTSDITDMYNVPFDSDIYAVPVDVVHSKLKSKGKKPIKNNKKRGKSTFQNIGTNKTPGDKSNRTKDTSRHKDAKMKRHSMPSSSSKITLRKSDSDVNHFTLAEMRSYLYSLYSSSSGSDAMATYRINLHRNELSNVSVHARPTSPPRQLGPQPSTAVFLTESLEPRSNETNNNHKRGKKNSICSNFRNRWHKDKDISDNDKDESGKKKSKIPSMRYLSSNLRQSFCNLFRWRRGSIPEEVEEVRSESPPAAVRRALPPLPQTPRAPANSSRRTAIEEENFRRFTTSIEQVKDYGWYWGNLSVEGAETILSNEPDGSFIVRDSSDDHYIFTLTFKLNGLRHVRIEHTHGNFCFGGCTMFRAQTIVEFIENAVETSRNGRYLFFLNLRPVLGPVRVQLLYPVSRFKRVQSLQHMCRFVIKKYVRRDLITNLPLPRRIIDYLNATHYYTEFLFENETAVTLR